jgi:hypothetical protein
VCGATPDTVSYPGRHAPLIVCELEIGEKSETLSACKQPLFLAVGTVLYSKKLSTGRCPINKAVKVTTCGSEVEFCWEICGVEVLDYHLLELDRETQKRCF